MTYLKADKRETKRKRGFNTLQHTLVNVLGKVHDLNFRIFGKNRNS